MRTDEQRRKAVEYLNRHPEQREKQRIRAVLPVDVDRMVIPSRFAHPPDSNRVRQCQERSRPNDPAIVSDLRNQ